MDKVKPLVSIVLPTYNRHDMLHISIESCLKQTYKNFELIVVDDGSVDETASVVKKFADLDPRVKYFRKDNGGLPRALNYGFERVNGEFLTWTSDDNEYLPNAIEEMVNKSVEFGSPCLVYANLWHYNKKFDEKTLTNLSSENKLNIENHIGACFLYNKKIQDIIGYYDTNLFLAEDYDYWVRISKIFPIVHLNKPLYIYSVHETTLSEKRMFEVMFATLLLKRKHGFINDKQFIIKTLCLMYFWKRSFITKLKQFAKMLTMIRKIQNEFI